MTIGDIVKKYMEENRHDHLINLDINCVCDMESLMSCEGPLDTCQVAHKTAAGRIRPGKKRGRYSERR